MTTTPCDRCFKDSTTGEHGVGLCPYEPRPANSVIGDECDVWVRHGLCHSDGSPRRFRSKSEMARVAAAKGLLNVVEHVPMRGSDKSPHTSKWF